MMSTTIDGPGAHCLEVHVEQQPWARLNKATDVGDREVLILHPQAHKAARELLQVDVLEAVLESGPGSRLQCAQHGRVAQVPHAKVKEQKLMDSTRCERSGLPSETR
jgi:hypothetical protein